MKTFSLRKEDVTHRWFVVDATGQPLGRLASRVAQILRGKHKPTFTPHLNSGDCVVVVNAARVKLTGRKLEQKRYFRHTGYMGHERFAPLKNVLEKRPERVIEKAVWGMLPKTTLSRQKVKQMLKVYAGPEHPHAAQQPSGGGSMSSAITPELRWHAVGRRKVGVARVYLTPGSGKWNVNGRTLGDYFPRPSLVSHIQQPFTATDTLGAFDVRALCRGGGVTGQAGAMRLAIARALCLADERHRKKLREQGLLTRDPRVVERKKPGRAGARKRFQFSKR